MLNVEQLIELEVMTRELVADLEKELEKAIAHSAPPGKLDGTEGRLSRQDSLMSHELAKEGIRRKQLRLQELREALLRMDAGTFGICANCGRPIEWEPLQLTPETRLCASCAG